MMVDHITLSDACTLDMGMTSGAIRDLMISSSSFRDVAHTPHKARLHSSTCWLAAKDDVRQYIQVDLLAQRYVTGVTTQGRSDALMYVSSYKVFFSTDGATWNVYREEKNVDKV